MTVQDKIQALTIIELFIIFPSFFEIFFEFFHYLLS